MGRIVDVDDLVHAGQVATMLEGVAHRKSLASLRSQKLGPWRHFPEPVIVSPNCMFWVRQDVETWDAARRKPPDAGD